jgi:hypothetical protein
MTCKYFDGTVYYNQYKDSLLNGYGIDRNVYRLYRGELIGGWRKGYGLMKYENSDEYDGQWEEDRRHGEGVFKEASTGRVERRIYDKDKVEEVLEVIEQGQ